MKYLIETPRATNKLTSRNLLQGEGTFVEPADKGHLSSEVNPSKPQTGWTFSPTKDHWVDK